MGHKHGGLNGKLIVPGSSTYAVLYKFSFESAHQLPNHPTCGVIHGHGYKGEIRIVSGKLTKDGFVVDFGALKEITSGYDHARVLTQTAEALAEEIGRSVLEKLSRQDNGKHISEVHVTLWETPNACAEWVWHVED